MKPAQQPQRERRVPLRRCVVCRDSRPQNKLLRLYRDKAGAWQFDLKRKAGGRGAWLCQDRASCHRVKALKRFFKQDAGRVAKDADKIRTALGFDTDFDQAGVKQTVNKPSASNQVASKPVHKQNEKGG